MHRAPNLRADPPRAPFTPLRRDRRFPARSCCKRERGSWGRRAWIYRAALGAARV